MSGIILDEYFSTKLLTKSENIGGTQNELLFALLMYEKAWIPSYLELFESDVSEKLISEEMLNKIPSDFYYENEANTFNLISNIQKSRSEFLSSLGGFSISITGELEYSLETELENQIKQNSFLDDLTFFHSYAERTLGLTKEIVFDYHSRNTNKFSVEELSDFYFTLLPNFFSDDGFVELIEGYKFFNSSEEAIEKAIFRAQ